MTLRGSQHKYYKKKLQTIKEEPLGFLKVSMEVTSTRQVVSKLTQTGTNASDSSTAKPIHPPPHTSNVACSGRPETGGQAMNDT